MVKLGQSLEKNLSLDQNLISEAQLLPRFFTHPNYQHFAQSTLRFATTYLEEDDVCVGLGETEEGEREDCSDAAVENGRSHRGEGIRGPLGFGSLGKYINFMV